ncbi:serine/threonine protein kinase [Aquabacter spiritensis]|uniref:Serine/threonine protein kinase n=1 Tax=Aquabacter spiritensis TaxID=933073 RepID=A0A4R3LXT3_9HYPH|nr:serine/threonine protein kinase [Aquabacter spiritensis]TCT04589.1 serine/threonine protein kinase [Aquabacter spiritensis]
MARHKVDVPPPEYKADPRRFTVDTVLKRDVFSTVERGTWITPDGRAYPAVRRRWNEVSLWFALIAQVLAARESYALARVTRTGVTTPLLAVGHRFLVRGWIEGVPLQIARPSGDLAFFRSAKSALRALHATGFAHNDLAKQQNWLRGADGEAWLTDFQLALPIDRRSRIGRVLAYEDLRHLLKHKRTYCPDALTPRERRVLARKSVIARVWMATGKRVYRFVTRRLMSYSDTEGRGPRVTQVAPRIAAALETHPAVSAVHMSDFQTLGGKVGLYAFVETRAPVDAAALRTHLAALLPDRPHLDQVQIVPRLPRDGAGFVRDDLLLLVARNQIEMLEDLAGTPEMRALIAEIARGRLNLTDRITRPAA